MTLQDLADLIQRHKHDGIETEKLTYRGTEAPATRPLAVGLIFCDTTNGKVYISTGTTDSTDWKVMN
jgi:hypothetical protein